MRAKNQQLQVSELFHSLQGESSWAGYPCAFIRLHGCNLRCSYCDARYSYEEPSTTMSLATIYNFIQDYPRSLVEITGGEPLLQEEVYPLMEQLLAEGRRVLLETNGSLDLSRLPAEVIKIMDIKCPDSGMADQLLLANLTLLTPQDELKFVLSSRQDYDWAKEFIACHLALDHHYHLEQGTRIIFSPVTTQLAPSDLAQWLLTDQLPVQLQLQLHCQLWPDKNRGV